MTLGTGIAIAGIALAVAWVVIALIFGKVWRRMDEEHNRSVEEFHERRQHRHRNFGLDDRESDQ